MTTPDNSNASLRLAALAEALLAVPNLSPEHKDGNDSERGDVGNLADALGTMDFMEPEDARAHARVALSLEWMARVLVPLDREAPEVAARVRAFMAEVSA